MATSAITGPRAVATAVGDPYANRYWIAAESSGGSPPVDSAAADAPAPVRPAPPATVPSSSNWIVSFAALLSEERARDLASRVRVGSQTARVVSSARSGSTIYRVVIGPFPTRADADKAGRESGQTYWVYQGVP